MNLSKEQLAELLKSNPALGIESHTFSALNAKSDRVIEQTGKTTRNGKYNATRTEYNGVVYPSKGEAQTAQILDLQIKAGEIGFYLRQVPFALPGGVIYRADFVTFKTHIFVGARHTVPGILWKVKVIEKKGYETPEWKLKLKLFRQTYPNLEIQIV